MLDILFLHNLETRPGVAFEVMVLYLMLDRLLALLLLVKLSCLVVRQMPFVSTVLDAHVLLFSYVCQSLHEKLRHLVDRVRLLELVAEQQSLYFTFQPVTDFLVHLIRLHLLVRLRVRVLVFELDLTHQWHLKWRVGDRRGVSIL